MVHGTMTGVDDLEARTQKEVADIVTILTELTGLPSRWSGRVELVPEADFKGRKRPICDIQIDAALVAQETRWATLIHEALHSVSVGYNGNAFRQLRGWEEGVVEQLQRAFRPMILDRLGVMLPDSVFHPEEEAHAFNGYIAVLESLRLMLKEETMDSTQQSFYLNLLALPLSERPDSILRISFALEQPQRGIFLSAFSRANSVLKLKVNR